MKTRPVLIVLSLLVCLGALWAVQAQRQQLAALRSAQEQPAGADTPLPEAAPVPNESQIAGLPTAPSSPEILRLRNQATMLMLKKRELAGVVKEAERLQAQLAEASTNPASGIPLPPGYIRKSQARPLGYSTPEATVETLFWALQNRDFTNLLATLAPELEQRLRDRFEQNGRSADGFFNQAAPIPGFVIKNKQPQPDGSVDLAVEVAPGVPTENFRLQPINGEWKLVSAPF